MEAALTLTEILAIVMFGEAGILHDDAAALAVGHVFLNRLESESFGDTPLKVAEGFNAFKVTSLDDVPDRYMTLAKMLWLLSVSNAGILQDPTRGCLYIISHQDTLTLASTDGGALWLALQCDWTSKTRVIDGTIYALYAYREFPEPEDLILPPELARLTK